MAKKKQAAKARSPRRRALPGLDDSAISDIEARADDLLDARESASAKRKEASEEEGAAEEALRQMMHKYGKDVYRRLLEDGEELEVKLREGAEKVLCRKRKARKSTVRDAA